MDIIGTTKYFDGFRERTCKIGRCDCGTEFPLMSLSGGRYAGTCSCPNCDQYYNIFGQKLKNPEEWDDEDEYGDYY